MPETWILILLHQLIFQGMFVIKNSLLRNKIGKKIRGDNIEATISIIYFASFIIAAIVISFINPSFSKMQLLSEHLALSIGIAFLLINLLVSAASLIHLKDSWRVGVLEDQKTELVTSGIYQFTRNPYFVSYFLMFAAYTVLLQDLILFILSVIGVIFTHKMIVKEESYLFSVHGGSYTQYKKNVPRYIIKSL